MRMVVKTVESRDTHEAHIRKQLAYSMGWRLVSEKILDNGKIQTTFKTRLH